MAHVVFVVPFVMDATLRFVQAAADLEAEGVVLGVISQDPIERFPPGVRAGIRAFQRVQNALDGPGLTAGVRRLAGQMGGRVDRLIGILEPLQEALAATRAALSIPGMRPEAAHRFRDKAHMKDVLRADDLPCARHRLCRTPAEALAFARATGYPLVVKPPAGAGAKNTLRVDRDAELESYLRSLPPRPESPVLLEEFLAGAEFSFDTVTIGGKHLMHSITEYTPTPLEVMDTPWIQWTVMLPREIDGPEFAPIHTAGPRALEVLGMDTGITHMEWFRREDGSIAISEVAARPPGAQFTSLLGYAYERDFYKDWVRIVGLDQFAPSERKWATGAAFLRGQGPGAVQEIHGIDAAQKELGSLVIEAKLPQHGQPKASSYEGEGFVILRHTDTEAVRQGLRRLVTLLQVEMG